MLEHERGITAEYLIEKIKAAIIIAVKDKNYEVEEDHVKVDIDPDTGRFDVALIQDVVADEAGTTSTPRSGITEPKKIRKTYEVGEHHHPFQTKDFVHCRPDRKKARHPSGHPRGRAQPASEGDPVPRTRHRAGHRHPCVDLGEGIVPWTQARRGEAILPPQRAGAWRGYTEGQSLPGSTWWTW